MTVERDSSRPSAPEPDTRASAIGYFNDELARPFLTLAAIAATIVDWPSGAVRFPALTLSLFIVAATAALLIQLPQPRPVEPLVVLVAAVAMLSGAALFPLAHGTSGTILPYLTASAIGAKLTSRGLALGLVAVGASAAAGATAVVAAIAPDPSLPSWLLALTVGLPVFIGVSQRDRQEALRNARDATEQARRGSEAEAREATLLERNRIAGEIHDLLGHSLSGIALQLDLAEALTESGRAEEAAEAVRRARAMAVEGIGETRRAVHALAGDDEPVAETVRRLAQRADCVIDVVGEPATLPAPATHAVVRTVQEALTNAIKHAPTAPRSIRLALDRDPVVLTVHNGPAGRTAPPVVAVGAGAGLETMRGRANRLGGTLKAGPAADGGWTVELELPR